MVQHFHETNTETQGQSHLQAVETAKFLGTYFHPSVRHRRGAGLRYQVFDYSRGGGRGCGGRDRGIAGAHPGTDPGTYSGAYARTDPGAYARTDSRADSGATQFVGTDG